MHGLGVARSSIACGLRGIGDRVDRPWSEIDFLTAAAASAEPEGEAGVARDRITRRAEKKRRR